MLEKFDYNNPNLVSVYDELPLWAAPCGLTLLNTVKLLPDINVLDVGCGTGFPLLELAQRIGQSSYVYGIDPWEQALVRIRFKIKMYNIKNVSLINDMAENMPFKDEYFKLIVSNNGINNVNDQKKVLSECFRVSQKGAQFVMTVNGPGTMKEFYTTFEKTLYELSKTAEIEKMKEHIYSKRKPLDVMKKLLVEAGFIVKNIIEDSFSLRFINGTAMFNYYFIRLAFLIEWKKIVEIDDRDYIFKILEEKLNKYAQDKGELRLTVPFMCIDCEKK